LNTRIIILLQAKYSSKGGTGLAGGWGKTQHLVELGWRLLLTFGSVLKLES